MTTNRVPDGTILSKKLYSLENFGSLNSLSKKSKINVPILDKSYTQNARLLKSKESQNSLETPQDWQNISRSISNCQSGEKIKVPEIKFHIKRRDK